TWPAEASSTEPEVAATDAVMDATTTTIEFSYNTAPPTTYPGDVPATVSTVGVESSATTYSGTTTTYPYAPGETFLVDPPAEMTVPCLPTGQYRCLGNMGSDDQGYTYFEYCEPTGSTNPPIAAPTTTVVGSFVVIVDASGLPGAADDMFNRLSNSGFGAIQVLSATRAVEQTMLVPIGELQAGGSEILQQLTGIDGFDTWTPDMIDGDLPMGVGAVVIIGEDYWDRMTLPMPTLPPTTTTVPDSTVSAP
ncbi:MAG: LytR C-terminal domain-containing protein, partial [Ilumatobacteraceae bacterium]